MSTTVTLPSVPGFSASKVAQVVLDDDIDTIDFIGDLVDKASGSIESTYRQNTTTSGENYTVSFKTAVTRARKRQSQIHVTGVVKTTSTLTDAIEYEPIDVFLSINHSTKVTDAALLRRVVGLALFHALGPFDGTTGANAGAALSKFLNGNTKPY